MDWKVVSESLGDTSLGAESTSRVVGGENRLEARIVGGVAASMSTALARGHMEAQHNKLDLSDVSSASFFERQDHYLKGYGGSDINARLAVLPMANTAVQAEMLDEIHLMLRHLCGIKK